MEEMAGRGEVGGNWSLGMELERWNVKDHVRAVVMLVISMIEWFARVLLVFLPSQVPVYGLTGALELLSQIGGGQGGAAKEEQTGGVPSGAIGRALAQVLALVNDLPTSSRKYGYARALAEKIIQENEEHGNGYRNVNRSTLSVGFARTVVLLTGSLERVQNQNRSLSWAISYGLPTKLFSMMPFARMLLPLLPPPLAALRSRVGHFLQPNISSMDPAIEILPPTILAQVDHSEMAEKLAQELLWLAEKLADCEALEEGIIQWSSAGSLASLSLAASPRVQRSLVRLSALFVKEIAMSEIDINRQTKFKILVQWIPLCCRATHGGDGTIFAAAEKLATERMLENVISSLPESDQEVVLSIWLQEFVLSSTDWPNLQRCFDGWCHSARKLSYQSRTTESYTDNSHLD